MVDELTSSDPPASKATKKFLARRAAQAAEVPFSTCSVPRIKSCSSTSGTPSNAAKGQPTMLAAAIPIVAPTIRASPPSTGAREKLVASMTPHMANVEGRKDVADV